MKFIQMAHYCTTSWFQVFVKCSANRQQQRLYGMYDVISVLLFILYTGLENLIIDESCKIANLAHNLTYVFRLIANIIITRS